jgi:hypothetical protein
MKATLICPADRPAAAFLARQRPLALVPILGRSLLDLWLTELANRGATRVTILAADRPDEIRRAVGRGEAWGLAVEVLPETREPSLESVRSRFSGNEVFLLEGIPPSGQPIWQSPPDWFLQVQQAIPSAAPQRVGYRELSPGVWIHVRSRVSPEARLESPCWVGQHAWVGSRSRIGAGSIIEDNAYIDDGADIYASWVGPGTYVGALTELRDSLAWGRGLFNVKSSSFVEITDAFLMGEIGAMARQPAAGRMTGRLLALLTLVATAPIPLVGLLRKEKGQNLFLKRQAVRAPTSSENPLLRDYWQLAGFDGLLRRWPELWSIAKGDFAWVGNRPLSGDEARSLVDEFERLWLSVTPGMFSLADAEGCTEAFGDEARAHASFYAVQHSWKTDLQILRRVFPRLFSRAERPPHSPETIKTASV